MRKIRRSIDHFAYLRALIGLYSATVFAFWYCLYKLLPARKKLYWIPLGRINFYFPSVEQFGELFTEIFLNEYYYIKSSQDALHVLDCGANIGVSLLYIKMQCPNARVICFEPNPATRAVLERNVEANNWQHEVTVQPYALGKVKGTARLFVNSDLETSSGSSLTNVTGEEDRQITIETEQLSDSISGTIDFLKMDIEGAEFDVLEDLIENKKMAHIKSIQLEYHYHPQFFPRPLSEILQVLESAGFRVAVLSTLKAHVLIGRKGTTGYMVYGWR